MNITIPVSKHSKLLLKPLSASYLLNRHLCTKAHPQPPPNDDESRINEAVQLLRENPHQQWFSNKPLRSLFSSSPSPSPCFLYKITRGLGSSSLALNFFKHLQQNTPSQHTHFLSRPLQALVEQVNRELDAGSWLSKLYQASK